MIDAKSRAIEKWIADGRMAAVDPRHFFTIRAATQTYADFEPQVCAVLGVEQMDAPQMDAPQMDAATEHLTSLLLRGCGLATDIEDLHA